MLKKIIPTLFLLVGVLVIAQNKTLNLSDAVLQQYRQFKPDQINDFQWLPNTNQYTYFSNDYSQILIANAQNNIGKEILNLTDVNAKLNTNLRHLYGTIFIDESTAFIKNDNQYYTYNVATNQVKKQFETPKLAEEITFDDAYTNLAFTLENNLYLLKSNQETIPITEENNKAIVSGKAIARSEFGISGGIFWSPQANYLAFYQKDESQVADYPLLNIDTTPGELTSIKYPMAGQLSEKPKVGIYNVKTNTTIYITPRRNSHDYLTNVSFTPDEKYILIAEVNREQNSMHLNLYETNSGKFVNTLIKEENSKWVEPEHPAYFPSKKSNNFIWISEQDGFNNLYYYDLKGKLIKQLTHNNFIINNIIASSGDEVYFTATGENPTNLLAYKVDLKGNQTLITKNQGVHQVKVNHNGTWIFDEYSNHNTPSKSLLYNGSTLKSIALLSSENKLKDYAIGTAEIKTIKAADGKTDLYTRLIKPSNFHPNKKYPVLVYVYGGPHAQLITNSYLDGASLWMYWMAEQGYLVFTVDGRGSGNRGFEFESIIHRNLGKHEIDDQIKGIEYLKSLPYVDANRLAVHGWSFGGFMTTSLMLKTPDVFNVGVAGGPVTDWKYYEVMYGERYMDTPQENPTGYAESSLLDKVSNLKGKLLLIHGTVDDVVVMQHNLMLVKQFIEAEKQIDFFPYPMHKHNVRGKDRVHLMTKVLNYVIDNNQ